MNESTEMILGDYPLPEPVSASTTLPGFLVRWRNPGSSLWEYKTFLTEYSARREVARLRALSVLVNPRVSPIPPKSEWPSGRYIVELWSITGRQIPV